MNAFDKHKKIYGAVTFAGIEFALHQPPARRELKSGEKVYSCAGFSLDQLLDFSRVYGGNNLNIDFRFADHVEIYWDINDVDQLSVSAVLMKQHAKTAI